MNKEQTLRKYFLEDEELEIEKVNFSNFLERKFFEAKKVYSAFEDSWFALMQGIRNNPRLYKSKIYFADHPYKKEALIVYNHLCKDIAEFSQLLNTLLLYVNKNEVVWKNANPDDLDSLLSHGFRCYSEDERWDICSKYDDQTYPQSICSLEEIAFLRGSRLSQIRQQTRAVERYFDKKISIEPYNKEYKEQCELLTIHISQEIGENNGISPESIANANTIFLSHPREHSFVIKSNDNVLAFIAFDVRESTANFICLIYKRNPKYLSTYSMVMAAQALYQDGIQNLNLSGSELTTLDKWKNKFNPLKKINRMHVIWEKK